MYASTYIGNLRYDSVMLGLSALLFAKKRTMDEGATGKDFLFLLSDMSLFH